MTSLYITIVTRLLCICEPNLRSFVKGRCFQSCQGSGVGLIQNCRRADILDCRRFQAPDKALPVTSCALRTFHIQPMGRVLDAG